MSTSIAGSGLESTFEGYASRVCSTFQGHVTCVLSDSEVCLNNNY